MYTLQHSLLHSVPDPPPQPFTPWSHAQSTICCSLKDSAAPVARNHAPDIAPLVANALQGCVCVELQVAGCSHVLLKQ